MKVKKVVSNISKVVNIPLETNIRCVSQKHCSATQLNNIEIKEKNESNRLTYSSQNNCFCFWKVSSPPNHQIPQTWWWKHWRLSQLRSCCLCTPLPCTCSLKVNIKHDMFSQTEKTTQNYVTLLFSMRFSWKHYNFAICEIKENKPSCSGPIPTQKIYKRYGVI